MKINIYNLKKEKAGEIELSDRIFGVKWNADLVHQALNTQLANRRQPWAHAKDRAEVSGGGKKPWKQKGTGRARHGSIRSPLWIGGGATFGPSKERNFAKKINIKMKRLAIFSVLSRKIKDNELIIVDNFEGINNKTKDWFKAIKSIVDLRSKTVLVLKDANKKSQQSISNIKNVDTLSPMSLNVYDLLKHKYIILEKEAIEEIEKHYK